MLSNNDIFAETPFTIAEQLAEDHWGYVEELLVKHEIKGIKIIEFHYKSAFIHGYKHGEE